MKNEALTMIYRELDCDLAQLYYRIQGWNNEVQTPFVADDTALASMDAELAALTARVEDIAVPDRVYALLQHHFKDFLSTLSFMLENNRKYPEAALFSYYYMIAKIAWLDDRDDEIRCADLVERFREVVTHANAHTSVVLSRHVVGEYEKLALEARRAAEAARVESTRLSEHFPGFTEEQSQRVKDAVASYADFLEKMAAALEKAAGASPELSEVKSETESLDIVMTGHRFTAAQPDERQKADFCEVEPPTDDLSITVKMDPEEYRAVLRDRQGVDLDELLAWHREEIEKTRQDCFRIARSLNLPDTDPESMAGVNDILFRFEPPCETGEEMHARCNAYLKRTRALAHEYVKLPEEEQAVCMPIPQIYMASYAWGGYEGGDFRHAPYIGKMFLNQYNTKNITDGWIKLNALHESYPGHHCQFVRAAIDPTPETVKIGSRLIPILEGTCLRTESVFCGLFEEDPVFPLFIAYRRHHASVRIYVDLMMFYYGCTLEEAVQIYEKELAFDRVTARAQVQAHQGSPGYFTCYYYGMKKIREWEKEYGYSNKDYTELLFSAGYISMESLHMLVQMTPEEQQRYYTEFPSLMRE